LFYKNEVLKSCFVELIFICLSASIVFAYSGGTGDPNFPYQIGSVSDWQQLMGTSADWNKNFILIADVNLHGVALTPVGNSGTSFTGVLDGNSHVIRNVGINNSSDTYIGLFGYVYTNGQIHNLGEENININGPSRVGGLVGCNFGTISGCYTTGVVTQNGTSGGVGGLVGRNYGTITACHSMATVTQVGSSYVGGLVGLNQSGGVIIGCYAAGAISGNYHVGGLAGTNYETITACYANGAVNGNNDYIGGLVGDNYSFGTITVSYATGTVTGNSYVGGLTGCNDGYATITDCYATGTVTGNSNVGGLVGAEICYGDPYCWDCQIYCGTTKYSFWDVNSSGQTTSDGGGTPKTTAEMKTRSTFTNAGWDFTTPVWEICDGTNYPKLTWQQPLAGDFGCPDGVDIFDLAVFSNQWLLEKLSFDTNNDGIVNFLDFAVFANNWHGDMNQLLEFSSQWLQRSATNADIAPAPGGDGIVNFLDFAVFAENWLKQN
jgi:hypothetical protein